MSNGQKGLIVEILCLSQKNVEVNSRTDASDHQPIVIDLGA